jgi:hypothetical protein
VVTHEPVWFPFPTARTLIDGDSGLVADVVGYDVLVLVAGRTRRWLEGN